MLEADAGPAPAERAMRADARRNRDRILDAAGVAIAQHGVDASLEEIARRAGVGSATLHRHFPSRQSLLEAVFRSRVEALCAKAGELAADLDPETALFTWLRAVGAHAAANRGLAPSLMRSARDGDGDPTMGATCHTMIISAGSVLLEEAVQAQAVRPGIIITDLLKIIGAISLAAEQEPDGEAEVDRLITLAFDGVRDPNPSGAR